MVGKPPLARSAALEAYAAQGAMIDTLAMQAHKHFSDTGGGGIAYAENECPSWLGWSLGPGDTIQSVVADCFALMWAEGPGGGHYENIIGNYAKLGCGIYVSGSAITITQDYGP